MNYLNHYNNLISKAKNREITNQYTELHHIIPRCLGGSNDLNNKVRLTAREHFISHLLLSKAYSTNKSLLFAFNRMFSKSINNTDRYINSRFYQKLREKLNKHISKMNKGRKFSEETRQRMSISHKGKTLTSEQRKAMSIKFSGKNNPMFGKKISEETKKLIGMKRRGHPGYWLGKKMSYEVRKNMSISRMGTGNSMYGKKRVMSEFTKQKISQSMVGEKNHFYGKEHNTETKCLISKNRILSIGKRIRSDIQNNNDLFSELTYNKYKRPRDPKFSTYVDMGGLLCF